MGQTDTCIVLVKSGTSIKFLAKAFGVSPSYLCREIVHIIPILFAKIRLIHLFDNKFLKLFPTLIGTSSLRFFDPIYLIFYRSAEDLVQDGAIDCTTHQRDRVHPGPSTVVLKSIHEFLVKMVLIFLSDVKF